MWQIWRQDDFSGGENKSTNSARWSANQVAYARNFFIDQSGGMTIHPGTQVSERANRLQQLMAIVPSNMVDNPIIPLGLTSNGKLATGSTNPLYGGGESVFAPVLGENYQVLQPQKGKYYIYKYRQNTAPWYFTGDPSSALVQGNLLGSPPINVAWMCLYAGRVWAIDEDRNLRFSNPDGITWDPLNIIVVTNELSDLKLIIGTQYCLYVVGSIGVWRLLGSTPDDFVLEQAPIIQLTSGLNATGDFLLTSDAVYSMQSQSPTKIIDLQMRNFAVAINNDSSNRGNAGHIDYDKTTGNIYISYRNLSFSDWVTTLIINTETKGITTLDEVNQNYFVLSSSGIYQDMYDATDEGGSSLVTTIPTIWGSNGTNVCSNYKLGLSAVTNYLATLITLPNDFGNNSKKTVEYIDVTLSSSFANTPSTANLYYSLDGNEWVSCGTVSKSDNKRIQLTRNYVNTQVFNTIRIKVEFPIGTVPMVTVKSIACKWRDAGNY